MNMMLGAYFYMYVENLNIYEENSCSYFYLI